ncbi:DNA replication and repair protein RecF [Clostridium sp. C105KSO15]|nr:DNA replication and repair protein RecF [Clostridium sp. C105KSO15]
MEIAFVEVQNFRKLQSCRIDFGKKSTVFVGANNSGKTSAMTALRKFLKKRQLMLDDFTISNLASVKKIGKKILDLNNESNITLEDWNPLLPSLDVWLNVEANELRYVAQIIPTLDWREGLIGIRLIYEPKDIEKLFASFSIAYKASHEGKSDLKLWPLDMCDFLREKISSYFTVNAYVLDPSKIVMPSENNIANPQLTPTGISPLDFDPFKELIRIDIISAQRGLDDSDDESDDKTAGNSTLLSDQLRSYYDKQLDPEHQPTQSDIKALKELQGAKEVFDKQISKKFSRSMKELAQFGYPGRYNPRIIIESKTRTSDVLSHSTSVRYPLYSDGEDQYKLPEKYNGLGYQNLISMSFKLMSFRDSWMNGDKRKPQDDADEIGVIPPIHLILIEEPEAHLHAQVQQVFIKNAYQILRNHSNLKTKSQYTTQMVVTTHSSYIALETDFSDLRYFRRIKSKDGLPVSAVSNLKTVFGKGDQTAKFVTRYLKTTHCDLFFADAVIMVEGAAERMFLPHFIENSYNALDQAYISILEINGRHAHRLKGLIEQLGITCLIITDIDTVDAKKKASVMPRRGEGQVSTNTTITDWLPNITLADDLWSAGFGQKEILYTNNKDAAIRVAYQTPVVVKFSNNSTHEFIPTTFEDSLAYENFNVFKRLQGNGSIKKLKNIFKTEDATLIPMKVYELIYGSNKKKPTMKKAEFALDLLYNKDPKSITPPHYIAEALEWLQKILIEKDDGDFLESEEV